MKKLLATVSVVAVMAAAPAFAGDATKTTTNAPETNTATMTDKSAKKATMAEADALKKEMRASNLIGKSIVNASNEAVGDINDILVDGKGEVSSVIIGVGGFLGLGEKNVEMKFDELQFSRDKDGNVKISAPVTKESLEAMPAWQGKKS